MFQLLKRPYIWLNNFIIEIKGMSEPQTLNYNKVFIGNIPYDISKPELEAFFRRIGPIRDLKSANKHPARQGRPLEGLRVL